MALDTARKRRAAVGIPGPLFGPGIIPTGDMDTVAARQAAGYGYPDIEVAEAAAAPGFWVPVGAEAATFVAQGAASSTFVAAGSVSVTWVKKGAV